MIVPAELTAMPQSYVIAAGLRANPDAAEERTELETLCWLNMLRYNMAGGRVSGFIKIGRSYRQAFETTVNAPGVTEDECRRMAEMSEQVGLTAQAKIVENGMSMFPVPIPARPVCAETRLFMAAATNGTIGWLTSAHTWTSTPSAQRSSNWRDVKAYFPDSGSAGGPNELIEMTGKSLRKCDAAWTNADGNTHGRGK